MKHGLACAAFFTCRLFAQSAPLETPILRNSGTPLNAGFRCTDEDLQWAGMTCSEEEPCPVYLELSHIAAAGQKIFVTGNIHSAANTLYSVLLSSEDNGLTWREPIARIRGGELDNIEFFDFETGWISGQLLQPLPGDAFLLISTDGGKSWRKRPVLDEAGPGSISAFRFDSRKNGTLLLDRGAGEGNRYQLFESPNGGESWMIRETSSHPLTVAFKPRLGENQVWRIRADSPSKSLRIEKRDGENWKSVTSFLLRIADCKPEPGVERAPPSETPEVAKPKTDDFVRELRLGGPGDGAGGTSKKKKPR